MLSGWDGTNSAPVRGFLERGIPVVWYPVAGMPWSRVTSVLTNSMPVSGSTQKLQWEDGPESLCLKVATPDHPVFLAFAGGEYGDPARGRVRGRFAMTEALLPAAILIGRAVLGWRASARLSSWSRWVAFIARCFALLALAMIALNWGSWRKPEADVKPRWCVMLDRSASMATADMNGQSRWALACQLAARWRKESGDKRNLDILSFSDTVDGIRQTEQTLAAQTPDGKLTDIGRALEMVTGVGAIGGGRPTGIILVTDGRQTIPDADPVLAGLRARAQDAPVMAVPLGEVKEIRDISIKVARRLAVGFVGQSVRIQADVITRWPSEVNVAVQLLDGTGHAIATNMEVTAVYRTAPERFFKTDPAGIPQTKFKSIFPDTVEELGAYDIVVFGKGSEYFMTPERLMALKTFVADQGGSVVFARGRPYADQGGGLEDLEPVEWGGASSVDCQLMPREEGEDIGLFAGMLPGRDDAVWSRLPLVRCSQMSVELKSFAQVLAEGRRTGTGDTVSQAVPLRVSRRWGKGMTVVMNVDGLWQWSFFPTAKEAAGMYEELWTQMLLWVGTYSEFLPGHDYALHLGVSTASPGMPVRVQVRRRGAPETSKESPRLRITRGSEPIQEMMLAEGDRADSWESVLSLAEPGLYRVTLVPPPGSKGRELGALLQIQTPPGELDNVNPDPEYLEKIAEPSSGLTGFDCVGCGSVMRGRCLFNDCAPAPVACAGYTPLQSLPV